MANPFLNDKAMKEASQAGWAAPAAPDMAQRSTSVWPAPGAGQQGTYVPPIDDGPISTWRSGVMTVGGTISATAVLLAILLASATAGWFLGPKPYQDGASSSFPMLAIVAILVGFGCAIAVHFKPLMAKYLGPVYALAYGFFLGVISRAYEEFQNGIVVQAIGATLGVFAVMLVLYKTRILKVTDRFKRIVITATIGLMAFYFVSFMIFLFTGGRSGSSFLNSTSLLSIGFSILAAGLAAMMLAIDFDFIEKGAAAGLPKGMEWYAAFGLTTTLVWLYLEMLRLLSKLQSR
ncbi:MAG: Bax inhibitor-1/YccA family protein [Ilumatobacteraceae bacterium]